ncbi:cysteine desulfurase [bacterium]|nr:cysteine desulfurase [bacterium]
MSNPEKRFIYLDHSATTPIDPRVVRKMTEVLTEKWGNPSSLHQKGREAKIVLEEAREKIASMLACNSESITFTSGGTEADNLAVFGVMFHAEKHGKGKHLITSAVEHSAIAKSAAYLEKEGFQITRLPVDSKGFVDPDELRSAIKIDTVLVSIMHVNNEIGTIQPIGEMARICAEREILFHTDAVQSFGKIPLDVSELPIDLVSLSSHKIYGPKGVGAIYIRPGVELLPRTYGGGQEKDIRTGTENLPGIAGFGEAVAICSSEIVTENSRLEILRNQLLKLVMENIEGEVIVNGDLENRLGANLNLSFPAIEGESMLRSLDLDGIAASSGSACSSGSAKPSSVLLALGLDERTAQSSLRLSLGRSTTESDIKYTAERICYHANRLMALAF